MKMLNHVRLVASGGGGFDWTDPCDCNVYVIDGGNETALIDAGAGGSTAQIMSHLFEESICTKTIKYIFLTHLHADHAGGAAALREMTRAKVALTREGKRVLERGDEKAIDLDRARLAGFYDRHYRFKRCKADLLLDDGDVFRVGNLTVRVIVSPGHSRFDTYYLVKSEEGHVSLFSGDGLFFGGRISMLNTRDFDLHALARTMARLIREKVDSLFPGHNQPAICRGSAHIAAALKQFDNLRVPLNIV